MTAALPRTCSRLLPVGVCAFALPFCALIVRPWVQLGIIDDWSYIRSAQVLANTGKITYFGWASAMLGWQLYLGALCIKLFGFSFSAPRIATLLVAIATAVLIQRIYVRAGLREWTSTALTLAFLGSPVFLAVTFSFMSDVYGLFVLIACAYCCVRALQTARQNTAAFWVATAAISAGIGGSARQIAWIGVLVMVPCALWLLRHNRRALLFGGLSTVAGVAMIPAFLSWFNKQPYSLPESVIPETALSLHATLLHLLPRFVLSIGFELSFLISPLLCLLLPAVFRNRRALLVGALVAAYWLIRIFVLHRDHSFFLWEFPYMFNSLWFQGWEMFPAYLGSPAYILTDRIRLCLTALVFTTELVFVGLIATPTRREHTRLTTTTSAYLSTHQLLLLFGPCTLAYLILLFPRFIAAGLLDRYMLFPEFILLGVTTLLYQSKIRPSLPSFLWLGILGYIALNSMGLHDTFNLFRAQTTLLERLQDAGIPRTQLDGGAQFNGWTEILTTGHLNEPHIRVPAGLYKPVPVVSSHDSCHTRYLELTPSVHAHFVVSFDQHACGGRSAFEESYTSWLGPRSQTLYAVNGPFGDVSQR